MHLNLSLYVKNVKLHVRMTMGKFAMRLFKIILILFPLKKIKWGGMEMKI